MASSALLTLDVQRKTVKAFGENNEYVERVSRAVRAARGAGMPVIHVIARFRAGHPEDSPHNKMLGILRMMGGIGLTPDDESPAVHPAFDRPRGRGPRLRDHAPLRWLSGYARRDPPGADGKSLPDSSGRRHGGRLDYLDCMTSVRGLRVGSLGRMAPAFVMQAIARNNYSLEATP